MSVVTAASAGDALGIIAEQTFDVAVLDIKLPTWTAWTAPADEASGAECGGSYTHGLRLHRHRHPLNEAGRVRLPD